DPRIVGHARADEPDALRLLRELGDRGAERLRAAMTYRPVDLTFEAEATASATALADLEQRHVAVLGVRRTDERDGLEVVDVLQAALGDHRRRTGPRDDGGEGRVGMVSDVVPMGHVDARDRRGRVEEHVAIVRTLAPGADEVADELLALTDRDDVHERRH